MRSASKRAPRRKVTCLRTDRSLRPRPRRHNNNASAGTGKSLRLHPRPHRLLPLMLRRGAWMAVTAAAGGRGWVAVETETENGQRRRFSTQGWLQWKRDGQRMWLSRGHSYTWAPSLPPRSLSRSCSLALPLPLALAPSLARALSLSLSRSLDLALARAPSLSLSRMPIRQSD